MKRTPMLCAFVLLALAIPTATGVAQQSRSSGARPDPFAEAIPADGDAQLFRGDARTQGEPPTNLRASENGGKTLPTGFGDLLYQSGDGAKREEAFSETKQVNASVVRLAAIWRNIAPATRPASFDPTDPGSPGYNWTRLDTDIQDAQAHGLRVLLLVNGAPDWAEGSNRPASAAPGTWKPNGRDLQDFATALARRYSGDYKSLPQVRDYQVWAEPNLQTNLTPQSRGTKPISPTVYREMLNGFYKGARAVDKGNRIVTGGTAPYGLDPGVSDLRPLLFWKQVMCVKGISKLRAKKCPVKPSFDVLAHHPIDTSGGPHTSAIDPEDVSTPDLHNLVDVLRVAERAHNIGTGGVHPVWATEIWWETNPPDTSRANPSPALQARWYEDSLHLLWKQGASLVLFLQVQDAPYDGKPGRVHDNFQTGLFYADGKPKPSARAVAFPFVIERTSESQVLMWGIAPKSGRTVVEAKGKGSKRVASFKVKAGKVFNEKVELKGGGTFRATLGREKSLNWKLKG